MNNADSRFGKVIKMMVNNVLAGVAVLFPLVATIILFKIVIQALDSIVSKPIEGFLTLFVDKPYIYYATKVVFAVYVFLLLALIGYATKVLVVRRFFSQWEKLLHKVPIVSKVYGTIKQFSLAIFGEKRKDLFKRVVLVKYPRKGLYTLGFVTSSVKGRIKNAAGKNMFSVFVPMVPNPTTGFLELVTEDDVMPLDISVEEGIKLVLSAGVVGGE